MFLECNAMAGHIIQSSWVTLDMDSNRDQLQMCVISLYIMMYNVMFTFS